MERENKKRGREEDKRDSEKNAKKQKSICFDDGNTLEISDSFRPLGVFDFPWMKENPVSESDDWKFDDVFSSSLIDVSSATTAINFSKEELCETPELIEFPDEKFEDESWPSQGDDMDGVDCIWSSVLNQPLSTESRKVYFV